MSNAIIGRRVLLYRKAEMYYKLREAYEDNVLLENLMRHSFSGTSLSELPAVGITPFWREATFNEDIEACLDEGFRNQHIYHYGNKYARLYWSIYAQPKSDVDPEYMSTMSSNEFLVGFYQTMMFLLTQNNITLSEEARDALVEWVDEMFDKTICVNPEHPYVIPMSKIDTLFSGMPFTIVGTTNRNFGSAADIGNNLLLANTADAWCFHGQFIQLPEATFLFEVPEKYIDMC